MDEEIHYTSYVRQKEDGFEYGYIEQNLGHVDISKGFQGSTIRSKRYHKVGIRPTMDAAIKAMNALPLKTFGGISDEEWEEEQ